MTRYEVMKQFTAGVAATIACEYRDESKSEHWLAGWDAGYPLRKERNRLLNEYLISTGRKPQAVITICEQSTGHRPGGE